MLLDEQGIPRLVQNIRAIPRPGNTSLLVVHLFDGRTWSIPSLFDARYLQRIVREQGPAVYERWEKFVASEVFGLDS